MEVIRVSGRAPDVGAFLREAMLSQRFADVALCCPGGHKFLAHRLVLSAASPYLEEVLLAHSKSGSLCEPVTVILAEIEGPELAALLGLVYTGSAAVPRARLEPFLRAAETLRIHVPALGAPEGPAPGPYGPPERAGWPRPATTSPCCPDDRAAELGPGEDPRDLSCRRSCCEWGMARRQVANQVTASPWSQIARPHHLPKARPIVLQQHPGPLEQARLEPRPAPARTSPALEPLGPRDALALPGPGPGPYPGGAPTTPAPPKPELSLPVSRLCDSLEGPPSDANNNDACPEPGRPDAARDEHKCEQCAKSFVTKASLKVHLRTHSGEKPFRCTDCGKQFSQLRNYKYHRSVHEGTREFAATCPECGKYFNDRGYLSSHMKIHRNRKEYACAECGKSFNQRVAYNMHARIHTGLKPHQCEQCGKAFSRKMLLKQHLRTHSGERPYQCQVCHKAFADRSNMTLHTRLHSGLKPYQCTLCAKAFTKKHHLKTHLNYHTGTKPYACPGCGLRFSQSSNMRTHYKKCARAAGGAPEPRAALTPPNSDPESSLGAPRPA